VDDCERSGIKCGIRDFRFPQLHVQSALKKARKTNEKVKPQSAQVPKHSQRMKPSFVTRHAAPAHSGSGG
jgi:hypothetical protein